MRCQMCYDREATTTTIQFHKQIRVCSKCKQRWESRDTEAIQQQGEAEAEFNAELDAGVYDLP